MTAFALLEEIKISYQEILKDALVGIYVHGSLAFGCYHPEKSDIDFLVVTETEPTLSEKIAMLKTLQRLDAFAPEKGFEMSVVLAEDCRNFRYPTPFSLHFSNFHKSRCFADLPAYCESMHGEDPDLAAHFTVTRAVGVALCGKPISEVFGAVPKEAYLDSIRSDVCGAEEEILEHPVYLILNLCRVLAYLRDGIVLSKKDGGTWALAALPEVYHAVVRTALTAYEQGSTYLPTGGEQTFARYMLREIEK